MSASTIERPILYYFPVCPYSHRVEILMALKKATDAIQWYPMDITQPRPDWLLEITMGTTALPAIKLENGKSLKESMVILRYLDDRFEPRIRRTDPYEAALEELFATYCNKFTEAAFALIINQDIAKRQTLQEQLLAEYRNLNTFLLRHNPDGTYLFDKFGFAEAVFTPFLIRFDAVLGYYEDFKLPETEEYARVRRWVDACVSHPDAQQMSKEQIIKLQYDHVKGILGARLPPGRKVSSLVDTPHWSKRPYPPKDKYNYSATDEELGLIQA